MAGKPVARLGDPGSHGGKIITGSSTVFVNGLPVARVADLYGCGDPEHTPNPITSGANTVKGEGQPIAHVGSQTACGAIITQGSPNVFVGDNVSFGGGIVFGPGVPFGPGVSFGSAVPASKSPVMAAQSFGSSTAKPTPMLMADEEWCERRQEIRESEEVSQAMEDAYGQSYKSKKENGGWIVRNPDGELKPIPVPEGGEYGIKMGDAPEGTVGWYHTHPNSQYEIEDLPSEDDKAITRKNHAIGIVMSPRKSVYFTPDNEWLLCP